MNFSSKVDEYNQVLNSLASRTNEKMQEMLIETIEEDSRKGGFIRVFPTQFTHKYEKFFSIHKSSIETVHNILFSNTVARLIPNREVHKLNKSVSPENFRVRK